MSSIAVVCETDRRRDVLRDENSRPTTDPKWNGIDYVSTTDDRRSTVRELLSGNNCRANTKWIRVHFLCPPPPHLEPSSFLLVSRRSGSEIKIDRVLQVGPGVFLLTRELQQGVEYSISVHSVEGAHIDPRHASHNFVYLPCSLTRVDPKPHDECPPPQPKEREINYLARDFASLRQVILDRLALIMPDWQERHIPDLGITLVELFAYFGDHLSYFQDAVATEAYLGTARSRISVRRHVRLVDYQLHEGCNARTFLYFNVAGNPTLDPQNVYFITRPVDRELSQKRIIAQHELEFEPPRSYESFELVTQPATCPLIGLDDVKNWAGFIACLVDAFASEDRSLAHQIYCKLPKSLAEELDKFAEHATTDPPAELIGELRDALNRILQQHCLWKDVDCEQLDPEGRILRMVAELARHENPAACNRKCLETVLPGIFGNSDRSEERIILRQALNEIHFYIWDQTECCLPIGSTSATLRDALCEDDSVDPPDSVCSEFLQRHRKRRTLKHLSPGDFLLFEEVIGPRTGNPADAVPTRRQVVQLTSVRFTFDPVPDPRTSQPRPIVEIQWDTADKLTFPLCISAITAAPECRLIQNVSVARGNVLLVDHGLTADEPEHVGTVPQPQSTRCCEDDFCETKSNGCAAESKRTHWKAHLSQRELTFSQPVTGCGPAEDALDQDVHKAIPAIRLFGIPTENGSDADRDPDTPRRPLFSLDEVGDACGILGRLTTLSTSQSRWLRDAVGPGSAAFLDTWESRVQGGDTACVPSDYGDRHQGSSLALQSSAYTAALRQAVTWEARPHLLASEKDDQHFVVETDNERRSELRFGNDDLGRRPEPGTMFYARYRIGNGPVGNVGAEKIRHVVYRDRPIGGILNLRNPLPGRGGTEPESLDHARLHAPHAFRQLQRAIIADDYRQLVMRDFKDEVQQARATLHWTGSQTVVKVTVDPVAEVRDAAGLLDRVEKRLHRYRRIGHCVEVRPPIYVPLDIHMTICVESGYLRAHVLRELLEILSDRVLPDGSKGFFHADNLTFGDSIYVSRLVWTAKQVSGVENVTVDKLQRLRGGDQGELAAGVLTLGALEIPLVENDGNRPQCGQICFDVRGER